MPPRRSGKGAGTLPARQAQGASLGTFALPPATRGRADSDQSSPPRSAPIDSGAAAAAPMRGTAGVSGEQRVGPARLAAADAGPVLAAPVLVADRGPDAFDHVGLRIDRREHRRVAATLSGIRGLPAGAGRRIAIVVVAVEAAVHGRCPEVRATVRGRRAWLRMLRSKVLRSHRSRPPAFGHPVERVFVFVPVLRSVAHQRDETGRKHPRRALPARHGAHGRTRGGCGAACTCVSAASGESGPASGTPRPERVSAPGICVPPGAEGRKDGRRPHRCVGSRESECSDRGKVVRPRAGSRRPEVPRARPARSAGACAPARRAAP